MKNHVLITLSLIGMLPKLSAQIDSVQLDEIYFSDNRIAISIDKTDRSVIIISKEEIQALPVRSIEELLSQISGIDVRQRGIVGVQADVSIRGGSFEQTLVLINGTRMSDVQTGHHSMDIPVNLNAVERIEIIKGPSARRFGQNAFSGAINIVTKTTNTPELRLGATAGEFGSFGINASAQTGGVNFQQMIQADYNQTDGYRHNTDAKKSDIWYQNKIQFGRNYLSFQGGFIEKKFGANGFYSTPAATEQYEETQGSLVNVLGEFNFGNWQLNPNIYWRRHQDMYVFVREDPSIYRNMHIGNTAGGALNSNVKSKLGTTGIGIDFRKEYLTSNNLGKWDRDAVSIFFEHRINFLKDKLSITPGALWTNYNDFGSFFFPGVDIGYSINQHHRVYGNLGKTYRTPTYTDLYYQDSVTEGNPDLKPEEALSYEIGYKFSMPYVSIEMAVFRRENTNLIDFVKQSEEEKWRPINLTEVDTNGIEIFAEHRFMHSFLNKVSFGYTYLDNKIKDSEQNFSKFSLDNLKHQFTAKLNHKIVKNISLEWAYRYNDRVTLDDYHLLDAKLQWGAKKWNVFFQGNNLLNTNYTETSLVPMPERWFSGGVSYKVI